MLDYTISNIGDGSDAKKSNKSGGRVIKRMQ